MKRSPHKSNKDSAQSVIGVVFPPTPCIPIIVRPDDLNGIYDYFLKAKPAKKLPIEREQMILVYDGEGGHA